MKSVSKAQKYLIVFSCMLLQAIPFGIAQNIPPLFIPHLVKVFGFSVQSIGYIFTIGALSASVVSPMVGKLYGKLNVKFVMMAGVIVSACGVLLNSIATQLWMFLLAMAITQIGTVTFSGLGVPYLIGTWFNKHEKATALGIAFTGGSIGNFFLQPIVSNLLANNGIHTVYLMVGVISLIAGLLVTLFLVRPNKNAVVTEKGEQVSLSETGLGYKRTVKEKDFWFLAASYFIIGLAIAALSNQYANYLSSQHVTAETIGIVGSTFAVCCLIGNFSGGILFSKIGIFKAMSVAFVLQLTAITFLLISTFNTNLVVTAGFVWAVFYGLNVFSYMSAPAVMIQNLFGMKDSSQILGIFSIFFAVGFAIGNIIYGFFVDKFGFQAAWISVFCYTFFGFLSLLFFVKRLERKDYSEMVVEDEAPEVVASSSKTVEQ